MSLDIELLCRSDNQELLAYLELPELPDCLVVPGFQDKPIDLVPRGKDIQGLSAHSEIL